MPEQGCVSGPRVLVFDIGNVLVTVDSLRAFAHLRRLFSDETLLNKALRWLESDDTRYELGLITTNTFVQEVQAQLGLDRETFIIFWNDVFIERPYLLPFLQELREQGYILAICSNTNALHMQILENLPWFSLIDHVILSYQVHARKPDLMIYHAVEAATRQRAAEHLLIDDLPENILGARAAGWDAIRFQHPEQVQAELFARGLRFTPWKPA